MSSTPVQRDFVLGVAASGIGALVVHCALHRLHCSWEKGKGTDSGEISTSGLSHAHHGVITHCRTMSHSLTGLLPSVKSCHG